MNKGGDKGTVQPVLSARLSMGAHHDEIDLFGVREVDEGIGGLCLSEQTGFDGYFFMFGELAQVEVGCGFVPLVQLVGYEAFFGG